VGAVRGTGEATAASVARVLAAAPIVDGHNDLPSRLRAAAGYDVAGLDRRRDEFHTDLPRLRAGGVGAQFWSVYVPSDLSEPDAVVATLEQIDAVHRMVRAYPAELVMAYTADDVRRAVASGRIASLIGVEGGHSLANSLGVLRAYAQLGVRYVTLTHNHDTAWAHSAAGSGPAEGLTDTGRAIVREMRRVGVLVDLSHVAPATMRAALDVVEAPVIFSHSSARAVTDHRRNVPDDVLRRLAGNGGVVQVTFVPYFISAAVRDWAEAAVEGLGDAPGADSWPRAPLPGENPLDVVASLPPPPALSERAAAWLAANPRPVATVAQVADHVEHARAVAGVDHIGLGGDFDGTDAVPAGLDDVSGYPRLLTELVERGWSEDDLTKLTGRNMLRVLAESERRAAEPLWPRITG
jgi:membrane dipeptidase